MRPQQTKVTVRALSCDAKIIGSLVGGCRVSIVDVNSARTLAQGIQSGGSGDTEAIMKKPRSRGGRIFDAPGAASFEATIDLAEPTLVEVTAEGPLAYPQAMQRASKSCWLIPGRPVDGDGITLTLHGFIVDVMKPAGVEVFFSQQQVEIEAGVRLL